MLYKVEIENFFSVGEHQEIDLRVRKSVDDVLGRLSPIYPGSDDRAPNVVALFGPNAAGKSNILRAIAFGAWFASKSFDHRPDLGLPYEKFGSKEKIGAPTRLSFSFAWPVNYRDPIVGGPQCPYTYEVVLAPRLEQSSPMQEQFDEVLLEKLSFQPKGRGKPTTIFERKSAGSIRSAKGFLTSGTEKALKEVLRPRASVISTLAQLNHATAKAFVASISTVISNIFIDRIENDEGDMARWYEANPDALTELQRIARRIDLGIEEITIDRSTTNPQMVFQHAGLDQIIRLDRESHGTRNFIKVFPYILMSLNQGGVAVIDKLDTTMHPLILPEILRWFGDEERNPHGAQLWTSCHSASLLSDLTKEEVLFCEKDSRGYTSVYKLADVENVRRNENFFGKYLGGEYGAVPVVG